MPTPVSISERSRRATLTVAISAIALETSLLGVVAPLLPEIERRTGAGDEALGLALAAYAIPILIISIPVGRLADRIGRRPLLLGGLLLVGLGSILIAVSGALAPLLVGRAVQGVGSTLSWVAALALVSDLARPGRKGEAIGFALAANSLGSIGGPALGGIAGGVISFEAPFILVSAIAASFFVVGWFVLPRTATAEPELEPRPAGIARALFRRSALLPAAIAIVAAATLGLIDFVLPLDLDRRLGTAATTIGVLFAAVAAIDAIAAPLAGRASDRIGRRPVALAGALCTACSGVLLAVLGGLGGASLGLAVLAVGIAITFAATIPWLDESYGAVNRGLAYGGLNLVYSIGYTVGPLLGGWLLGNVSADSAYIVIAVSSGIVAVALGWRGSRLLAPEGELS
jgi:MFS transporter, DHA1 family, solute carrier family 18 (vesicular amine transporter), member 1/2